MADEYTYIDLEDEEGVWVCDNCGAHANEKENVKHHNTCKAGESKRWEKYYSEQEE